MTRTTAAGRPPLRVGEPVSRCGGLGRGFPAGGGGGVAEGLVAAPTMGIRANCAPPWARPSGLGRILAFVLRCEPEQMKNPRTGITPVRGSFNQLVAHQS